MTSANRAPSGLDALLAPRSVAIVGATESPTRIGGRPLHYLLDAGFAGDVYPVNPRRETVQGRHAYGHVRDVPGPIDVAVIALPADAVLEAARDCAARGVRAAVVFSAGFAETGAQGAARQQALSDIARESGMRILGPNCLGAYNAAAGFYATFTSTLEGGGYPPPGRVGLVSQSGAYGSHVGLLARRRRIGVRYWVTTGNECDVEIAECIAWMARAGDVDVIVAYAEGVRDGPALLEALAAARAARKPVVFMKVGRTPVGVEAARSHTAALAGADAVYDAVLRQHGAHRAADTEELLDVAYACTFAIYPRRREVGLLTISGGVGIQMADAATALGLEVAPMPAATQARLKTRLPFCAPRNPVDMTAQVFNDIGLVGHFLEAILAEGEYQAVVAFYTYVAAADGMAEPILASLARARERFPERLLVVSLVGPDEVTARYEALGCPVFEDPTRAVRAVAALGRFGRAFAGSVPVAAAATPAATADEWPGRPLDEHEASGLLARAGVPMVQAHLAASPEEAVAAAERIGFPVALKVCSPEILHKSDVGGVLLGVEDAAAVRAGYARLTETARVALPAASLSGVRVARMVAGGVETILGVQRDPLFGPVVMLGLGGVLVEILDDVSLRLAPVDAEEAQRMIRELAGYPLLAGARGRPRADLDALASAVVALSRFACDHADRIESVDVNPFVVLPEGEGALGLDAAILPRSSP